jgi:hypothetical protein
MCSRCCEEIHRFSQNNNPSSPRSNNGGFEKVDKRDQGEIPGAPPGYPDPYAGRFGF